MAGISSRLYLVLRQSRRALQPFRAVAVARQLCANGSSSRSCFHGSGGRRPHFTNLCGLPGSTQLLPTRPATIIPRIFRIMVGAPCRPSAFQAGHIPSWRGSCERYALSPIAAASRWSLLLLSPLLSTRCKPSVAIGPAACRGWPASGPGRLRPNAMDLSVFAWPGSAVRLAGRWSSLLTVRNAGCDAGTRRLPGPPGRDGRGARACRVLTGVNWRCAAWRYG